MRVLLAILSIGNHHKLRSVTQVKLDDQSKENEPQFISGYNGLKAADTEISYSRSDSLDDEKEKSTLSEEIKK